MTSVRLASLSLFLSSMSVLATPFPSYSEERTIFAEAQYVMADGDTLATAEERVLQRAQRRAIEEAGIYLESTFHDYETNRSGKSRQVSSLEIRTMAAAITKTEVLESQRKFENDRPVFTIRIRALVDLEQLQEAVRRWRSEERLAEHFAQLQRENAELKAQLRDMQTSPPGVRTLVIEPAGRTKPEAHARSLVEQAMQVRDLRQKLDLASQATILAPQYIEPLIIRGQTYLRLVSLSYSNKSKPSEYSAYVDNARMDFDRALMLDAKNPWALLGQGDVLTWLQQPDAAAHAYEQAIGIDPFFDLARQRLIQVQTMQARGLTASKQWSQAVDLLNRILTAPAHESWTPSLKEAYLLRSEIYQKLNQAGRATEDLTMVLETDPTHLQALVARGKLYREQLHGRLAKDDFERACLLGSPEACEQLP
jgi:tetratricopeptide (TPR) repeat protein